jgi:NAD-dependent protein deacetylase/lipoamidase
MSAAALAQLIQELQPCVVLTGAGMSTESGLPDFRSATGIWAEVDPYEVATIDAFRRDPERVWAWYGRRIRSILDVEPNPGHRALAALERADLVQAVVTQNIDTLHERAGSVEVVEVHGSIRRAVCLACGTPEPLDGVLEQLEREAAPICRSCGTIPKPDVVLFGELLPLDAIARAEELARGAALLLVIGSSLQVWPVAGLPEETLGRGGTLAIVNREPTAYDHRAALVVGKAAGETLASAAAHLGLGDVV